ncbi:MAG: helix-turn-helix domain-containing protein [Nostoc sp.]|uniref:helix-turn-helix domain-containing protein n=1 Tax=Nostoc sp. TaxID=1180 RepID=UPI002FFA9946
MLEYVQSLRLEQAQKLLQSTNLTVIEIISQVEYENISHFGYLFKRQFGITSREYRQQKGL